MIKQGMKGRGILAEGMKLRATQTDNWETWKKKLYEHGKGPAPKEECQG